MVSSRDISNALSCQQIAKILGMNTAYVRRKFLPEMERFRIGRTDYVTQDSFELWLERHRKRAAIAPISPKNKPPSVLGGNVFPIQKQ